MVWVDTGILLALGTNPELLTRFRRRYLGRAQVSRGVDREVRGISLAVSSSAKSDVGLMVRQAAKLAVQGLLVDSPQLRVYELQMSDLRQVDQIKQQLRAFSKGSESKHGGEAELIVLAVRQMQKSGKTQLMLANDGAASVVARGHGLLSRHIGDLIGEFGCADTELGELRCFQLYSEAIEVSTPPTHVRALSAAAFRCSMRSGTCNVCDELDALISPEP